MTAHTRRWLIFAALCALLLLSLPAKYGRAESRSPDRTESPSFIVRANDREVHRLVLCTGRAEVRAFYTGAAAARRHKNGGNRPIETSCAYRGAPTPSWTTKA